MQSHLANSARVWEQVLAEELGPEYEVRVWVREHDPAVGHRLPSAAVGLGDQAGAVADDSDATLDRDDPPPSAGPGDKDTFDEAA